MDPELLLRTHIRQLLLSYALTHLTTNHIDYSQSEVSRILSESLDIVPLQDPTFLALTVEPFDLLSSLFCLQKQIPFHELWKADIEAKAFLLNNLGSLSASITKGPTTRCFSFDEDPDQFPEPMSTMLTRRALYETPEIGKLASSHMKIISAPSTLLQNFCMKLVPEYSIPTVAFCAKDRDFLLGVRYSIDKEMHNNVMHLMSHIACTPIPDGRRNSTHLSRAFLRDDSPPYQCQEHMSPPIFPVNRSYRFQTTGFGKLSEIQSLGFIKKVELTNDEKEMSKEHMQVLNGWTVIPESFSDTPSLANSSQTTEFDELFALTPPHRTHLPKMDEYLIPRVLQPGVNADKRNKGAAQNLSQFLTPLLSQTGVAPSSDVIEPQSSHPEIPSSVLGQPSRSHIVDVDNARQSDSIHIKAINQAPERLRTLIEVVCAPVHDESPQDCILSERLEETEALMMEVPKMKEPCIHPPSPSCPRAPNAPPSLIYTSVNAGSIAKPNTSVARLKKVPGFQSLNIELSWRPFNHDSGIPVTEELCNAKSFYPTIASELDPLSDECVKNVISLLETPKEKATSVEHVEFDFDVPMRFTNTFGGDYDLILNNADRRKVHFYYTGQSREAADTEGMISDNSIADEEERLGNPVRTGRSNKRQKIAPLYGANDFRSEKESTHLGQDLTKVDVPLPYLLSSEIDRIYRPPSQCYGVVRGKGGESPFVECDETGLLDSSCVQQGKEVVSLNLTSIKETSSGYISSITNSEIVNRNGFPSNNSKPSIMKQGLAPARQALIDFLHLRVQGKSKLDEPKSDLLNSPLLPSEEKLIDRLPSPPKGVPLEVVDANTIELPSSWSCPAHRLKYIASMNVLQKTVLLEHLELQCRIDLVERENLETQGACLILDVDTALLFVPLSSLHLLKEKLAERIAALSWRFSFIVVVIEAFSTNTALRPQRSAEGTLTPYPFPPVIIKAIKTLKKLLNVMEMIPSQTDLQKTAKLSSTVVKYAYAQDVLEAAKFARLVGDETGVSDTEWLSDEYTQDEKDLSCIPGMNIYAAAILLRYIDVSALVNISSMERLRRFSNILGEKRVISLNNEIESRLAIIASSFQSSNPTAPEIVEEDHKKNLNVF